MAGVWDWLTGREAARQEADKAAQEARQAQEKALEAGLERRAGQWVPKRPEAIQRSENEPRPGERWMPDQVERMRAMHDNPPAPQIPQKPDQVREATRMEYTLGRQAAPSMGGSGTVWINTRATLPAPIADRLVDESRAAIGQEDRQLTAAEAMRRAEAANPNREKHQPEDRIAAWRKNMTPDEQAAFDEERRQAQNQTQGQQQGPGLTQKQDVTAWPT